MPKGEKARPACRVGSLRDVGIPSHKLKMRSYLGETHRRPRRRRGPTMHRVSVGHEIGMRALQCRGGARMPLAIEGCVGRF
ncbi:UNVERIFIED_CONTAM: hypothetical protein Sradi_3842200 [Sesamum radiatum]|uniref:Uncharacterized protein n=1 Tax=Sesamum radiatum TaxID=300843 RepID=A0AAW2Q1J6_SESRA